MYCAPTATAAAAAAAFSSEEFADDDNFDAADVPAFSYEHGGDDMSVDQVRAAADRLCACVPVCLCVSVWWGGGGSLCRCGAVFHVRRVVLRA